MTGITVLLTAALVLWCAFCNCVELSELINRRKYEGGTLRDTWNREVEEAQSLMIGRLLMRTFYFVPTLVSAFRK